MVAEFDIGIVLGKRYQVNEYGDIPPLTAAATCPFRSVKQVKSVTVKPTINESGSLILNVAVREQPIESLTEYVY
ncbi:MAG: hypothetical protein BWY47_00211 [Bacteroidetes bacterium ADurb.Bin302]|nr:MAG: hypothetical protein BWY47_00211 [Bacteroidetes bacterium ADurb.Bin302]